MRPAVPGAELRDVEVSRSVPPEMALGGARRAAMGREAPTRPAVGCGDSGCPASAPGGMRTNGGCRCEAPNLRRAVAAWRAYALELERQKP